MKLLIVSHTPHYRREGALVGWGPTVREIDHLGHLFERIVHVAPLHEGPAPDSAIPYTSDRVTVLPLSPSGGVCLRAKLRIVACLPGYVRTILSEISRADVLHVRCPSGISLVAIILLGFDPRRRPRWIKYAGNWRPVGGESWSYRLQRWWLGCGLTRGVVTVNGSWPGQPSFVRSFLNPCLTDSELVESRLAAAGKAVGDPLRLLFVGRLEAEKGAGRALETLALVKKQCPGAMLDLVGDGPQRPVFERLSAELEIGREVMFHGWLPRAAPAPLYARSHLLLLPSRCSEGWPKVVSEAMAYGVVPVCSDVGSVPQNLAQAGAGMTCGAGDVAAYAAAVLAYRDEPRRWKAESERGVAFAEKFSYANYLESVRMLLGLDRPFVSEALVPSRDVPCPPGPGPFPRRSGVS